MEVPRRSLMEKYFSSGISATSNTPSAPTARTVLPNKSQKRLSTFKKRADGDDRLVGTGSTQYVGFLGLQETFSAPIGTA